METGLSIAGGGVPGCAAVGVLMAFEEAGIKVTHLAGTSSGAMVAALYACGYSPSEMTQIVPMLNRRYLDFNWKGVIHKALFLRPRLNGWFKGERLYQLMAELTENRMLANMRLPCSIVAVDVDEGKPFIFTNVPVAGYHSDSNASIAQAVRASFSIPLIFQPVEYQGRMLIDGGISANCPVQVCRAMGAKRVISIDPISPLLQATGETKGAFSILKQVILLTLKQQMNVEHQYSDLALLIDVGQVGAFDFHKAKQCVDAGYRAAKANMNKIIHTLQDL